MRRGCVRETESASQKERVGEVEVQVEREWERERVSGWVGGSGREEGGREERGEREREREREREIGQGIDVTGMVCIWCATEKDMIDRGQRSPGVVAINSLKRRRKLRAGRRSLALAPP